MMYNTYFRIGAHSCQIRDSLWSSEINLVHMLLIKTNREPNTSFPGYEGVTKEVGFCLPLHAEVCLGGVFGSFLSLSTQVARRLYLTLEVVTKSLSQTRVEEGVRPVKLYR